MNITEAYNLIAKLAHSSVDVTLNDWSEFESVTAYVEGVEGHMTTITLRDGQDGITIEIVRDSAPETVWEFDLVDEAVDTMVDRIAYERNQQG